ncbi:MAG: hypothetical protein JKX81_13350 [Arenicella sp.]|nr:hypothetical protein [Arenicella sp.]
MNRHNTMAVIVSFLSAMFLLGGQVMAQSTFPPKSISPTSRDQGWLYYGGDQGGPISPVIRKSTKKMFKTWKSFGHIAVAT